MSFSIHHRSKLLSLGLIVSACLAACGGGGGTPTPSTPTPTPAPVVAPAGGPTLSTSPVTLSPGIAFGTATWADGSTASGGHGSPVGGVSCLVNENYHVHSHLAIVKDGQALAIPAQIGLQGCAYELHTHDASGIIHVETASYHRLTLGGLFAVWGEPLSAAGVANLAGAVTAVYLNDGNGLLQYSGDIADIELLNHREITIVLGALPAQIPSYKWDPTY